MRKFGRRIVIAAGLTCFLSAQMTPLLAHPVTAPVGPAPKTTHTPTSSSSSQPAGSAQLPTNFSLNLSSTLAGLAASIASPVQIFVGGALNGKGNLKGGSATTITPGELLTPAQYVALTQLEDTGHQSLILNSQGAANGGFLTLAPQDVTTLASLTLPANVVLNSVNFTAQSPFSVSGQSQVNGAIYAAQSNGGTAFLSFNGLNVGTSGLISGSSLNINVAGSLTNNGRIAASNSLAIAAGGTIYNLSQANSPQATITGQSVNLSAASGNIVNSGLIAATTGNINIASSGANNLNITNAGGSLQALNGTINVGDATYNGSANLGISGGNLAAQAINLYAGAGAINVNVDNLSGVVSNYASSAEVFAQTNNLILGTIDIAGDPTYYNIGNITIAGNITVSENLAILATGNITGTSSLGQIVTTDPTGQGHDIQIIAGASLTPACGSCTTDATTPSSTSVTLDPSTTTGGNIDFHLSTLQISSASTISGDSGGNIVLAAFSHGTTGGQVLLSSASTINASGIGTGKNGNVTILAGNTLPTTAIQVGQIISTGGSGGGGNVALITAQPTSSDGNPITFNTAGTITSGNSLIASGVMGSGAGIAVNGNVNASGTVNLTSAGSIQTPTALTATITQNLTGTIKIAGNITGSAMSPSGAYDFVTNSTNNVYVINTATNNIIAAVTVGASPEGIAVSPNGSQVYVVASGALSVISVNTSTGTPTFTVTQTIPGLTGAQYVVVNPASPNLLYVSGIFNNAGGYYILNFNNNKITPVPLGAGIGGGGLAINPSGTTLYIGNLNGTNPGTVTALNLATNTPIATVAVGIEPSNIAINPSGTLAYVTNTNFTTGTTGGSVSIINTSFNSVIGTPITTANDPIGVAFNPSGTLAYISEVNPLNGATQMEVVNTATNTILSPAILGQAAGTTAITPAPFFGNFAGFNAAQQPVAYFGGTPSTSVFLGSTANINANQLNVTETNAGSLVQLTTSATTLTVTSSASAFITGSQVSGQVQTLSNSSATAGTIQLGTRGSLATTGNITASVIDLLATSPLSSITVNHASVVKATESVIAPASSLTINTPSLTNNGTITAVGSGSSYGVITIANDTGITITAPGTISASQATSTNGGGIFLLTSGVLTVATGTLNASASGANFNGGSIFINAQSLAITGGTLTLSASATGSGNYGQVIVATTNQGAPGDLVVGSSPGDLIINANGNTNTTNSGVDLQAGRDLTVDSSDLHQSLTGTNAQGGQLSLVAANVGGTGDITVNGSLILDGSGSGNGGSLNLGSLPQPVTPTQPIANLPGNANPGTLVVTGSISANGGATGGVGGQINVSNNSTTPFTIGTATVNGISGTISASGGSTSGNAGMININSTGTGGVSLINGSDIVLAATLGAGGNLSIAGQSINVANGNITANAGGLGANKGGLIFLNSQTTLYTAGNISANGTGTGNGGSIGLSLNSTSVFSIISGIGSNGVGGVISANATGTAGSGGTLFVQNSGTGGIAVTISMPTTNISLAPSASGGAGGTLALAAGSGEGSYNSQTGVFAPTSNSNFLGTGPITVGSGSLSVSATGNFKGGTLFIGGTALSLTSGPVTLSASGNGSGSGGAITVLTSSASSNITVGNGADDLIALANGGTTGSGGSITITAGGNLDVTSTAPTVFSAAGGTGGSGGSYNLTAGGPQASNPGNLLVSGALASSGNGSGNGGSITLNSNSTTAFIIGPSATTNGITGAITAISGAAGGSGGVINVSNANSGGITVASASSLNVDGFAGATPTLTTLAPAQVTLSAPLGPISIVTSAGNSSISASATNDGPGGVISILGTQVTVTGTQSLSLSANGISSDGDGDGGQITVTATAAASVLNIGSGTGGIQATATGTSSGTGFANGGSLSFLSGGNITVNTAVLDNEPIGVGGNGGHYLFAAGTRGAGNLSINNGLDTSAINGIAGSIILEANSATAFRIGPGSSVPVNGIDGTITANGTQFNPLTGTGGNVIVSNTGPAQIATSLVLPGDGLEIVAGGSITTTTGAGSLDTHSTLFSGGNILLIAGANVGFDKDQNIHVSGPSSTGGSINLVSGTPITAINAASLTTPTDGFSGGGVVLMALAGSTAATGTVAVPTAVTITTNGSPGTSSTGTNTFNVGIFAGAQSGTAISIGGIDDHASGSSGGAGNVLVGTGTLTIGDQTFPSSPTIYFGIWASHVDGTNGGEYFTTATGKANISVGSITTDSGDITFIGSNLISTGALSANGYSGVTEPGMGGAISIQTPATTAFIVGTGATTNGIAGSITANAIGTRGNAGSISIQVPNAPITFAAADIEAQGDGQGGTITITANAVKSPTGVAPAASTIIANDTSAGDGGTITITTTTTSGTFTLGTANGNLTLSANGGFFGNGGTISVTTAANLVADLSSISATPGIAGTGPSLTLDTTGTLTLSNSFVADGVGAGGGTITISAGTISMPAATNTSAVLLSANGTTGGSITVTTSGIAAGLTVGTAVGQMSFSASGTAGNAGSISVTTTGALTVTPTLAALSATASANGNGANLTFGTNGGILRINGSLNANADGTGTGGTITLNTPVQNYFVIGAPNTNGGVSGTLTAQGGAGGTINISTGTTAVTIATPSTAFNVTPTGAGVGTGGTISITTSGILTTTGGSLSANAAGGGATGGSVTISALSVAISSGGPLTVSANGGTTGNGGSVSITVGRGPMAGGIGTNANQIMVQAEGGSAGSVSGDAGTISLNTQLNLVVNPAGINGGTGGPQGTNGAGATINLTVGGTLSITSALSANGGGLLGTGNGNGGTIAITTTSGNGLIVGSTVSYGIAGLTAEAGTGTIGGTGGTISIAANAGPLVINNPSLLNVSTTNGAGGSITLTTPTSFTMQTGSLSVNGAGGNFSGGTISLTGSSMFVMNGAVILNANASGSGNGGSVSVTTTGSGNLTIGSANGNFEINATGGTGGGTPSTAGNGGTVNVSAGKALSLDFGVVNAGPLGTNGNGATLSFIAGAYTYGSLVGINSISADGTGTGNGGSITVTSNSPYSMNIGTAGLNGVAGTLSATGAAGGSITVSNKYVPTGGGITIPSENNIDVAPTAGAGGTITLSAGNGALNMTADAPLSANAVGSSFGGGSITLSGTSVVVTGGNLVLSAIGTGTGSGGSISLSTNGTSTSANLNIGTATGQISLMATGGSLGSAAGDGGVISISTTRNLTINNPTIAPSISAAPLGANGAGAQITLSATGTNSVMLITGNLFAGGSGSGNGGSLDLTVSSNVAFNIGAATTNGINGTLTASGATGGTIQVNSTGTGGITIASNGDIVDTATGGTGGTMMLNSTGTMTLLGGLQLSANGGGNGAFSGGSLSLSASIYKFTGAGAVQLSASGSGTGSGGTISITSKTAGTTGNFAVGTGNNQFSLMATGGTGGSAPSPAGNGGTIELSSPANITINASNPLAGLVFNPLGTDGNGGTIAITALNVAITGSLNVNALGVAAGDDGGNVSITTTSNTVFTVGGAIGLNGITGNITANAPGTSGVQSGNITFVTPRGLTVNTGALISSNSNAVPTTATAYGIISVSNGSATATPMTITVNGTIQDMTPITEAGVPVSSAGVVAFSNSTGSITVAGTGTIYAGRSINAGNLAASTFAIQPTAGGSISLNKTLKAGVTFATNGRLTLSADEETPVAAEENLVDTGEFAQDNDNQEGFITVSR